MIKQKRRYLSRGLGQACQVGVDGYLDWPDCKIHYDLTTTNSDFYSWVWDSMGDAHGTIHLWLGGVMDCESMYNKIGSLVGPDIAATLAFLGVGHRRSLFCEGIWSCEGGKVSVDIKPEEVNTRAVYWRRVPSCHRDSGCSLAGLHHGCLFIRQRRKTTVIDYCYASKWYSSDKDTNQEVHMSVRCKNA